MLAFFKKFKTAKHKKTATANTKQEFQNGNPVSAEAEETFDPNSLSYDEFIKDLSYYSMGKSSQSLTKLHSKVEEMFSDKNIVRLLHLYHIKSIEGKQGKNAEILLNYALDPEHNSLDGYDNSALNYKKLLNSMLGVD